jgi:hypothetical protein
MQLDKHIAVLLVRGDVVNRQSHALCHRAYGLEKVFIAGRARLGVHHHIGRDDLCHAALDGIGQFVNPPGKMRGIEEEKRAGEAVDQ